MELESSRTPKPAPSRSVCKRNGEQTNDQRGRNQDTAWPPRVPGNFRLTGHLTKTRMRVTGSFRSMNHLTRRLSSSSDYHGHKLLAAKGADCRVVSHTAPATIGRDTFDQAKSCELQALKSRRRARQEVQRARDARSTAHAVQLVGMLSACAPESSARNTAERMECGTHTRVCLGPPSHCTARV